MGGGRPSRPRGKHYTRERDGACPRLSANGRQSGINVVCRDAFVGRTGLRWWAEGDRAQWPCMRPSRTHAHFGGEADAGPCRCPGAPALLSTFGSAPRPTGTFYCRPIEVGVSRGLETQLEALRPFN